jgi:DNA-binding IclR family transcriptional regulator
MLSTLRHAGNVLDLFTTERPQWGVRGMARELGMSKSRAHELLASLAAIGLLEHVPRGRYRLGWRTLALAATQYRTSPLRAAAEPVMLEMAEQHAFATLLFVWERGRLLCVARHDPPEAPYRSLPAVGARFRPNGSAAAKVLMAYGAAGEIAALAVAARSSGKRPRSRESIAADLQGVRRRGYAGGREAGPSGAPAVAAPIRDVRDDAVAALTIAGSQSDVDISLYGDLVLHAARRISRALCSEDRAIPSDAGPAPGGGGPGG